VAEFTRPHVSYSELMKFARDCQHRWKIEDLEGNRRKIFSIHMDFGTAMHGAIERHRTRKRPVDLEKSKKIFLKYFGLLFLKNHKQYSERDLNFDPKKFSGPKDFFVVAGLNILTRLHECQELADAEVIYNEYPLFDLIDRTDGIQIKFKGFIDFVIKTKDKRGKSIIYICDFKTCSFGWTREKREDRFLQFQIFLYKYFFCKKFDIDPKQVRTAFVLLKKRPPPKVTPVEFFPVSAGPISVQRAIDFLNKTISEMVETTRNESWEKNRNGCVSEYGDICAHYNTDACPGKNDQVERKILELSEKRGKMGSKATKGNDGPRDIHKTTAELRAKLLQKKG
jgi:hypothetical protein